MTANIKVIDWVARVRQLHDSDIRRTIGHHAHDRQDLEDLTQDVYERLLKYDKDPELIKNLSGFICTTTKNWLISKSRRRRLKTVELEGDLKEKLHSQQVSSADLAAEFALAEERVAAAVANLKPTYRAVLEQTLEGRPDDDIADSLNLLPSVVRLYRRRAKACLFEACAPCQRRADGIRKSKVNDNGN